MEMMVMVRRVWRKTGYVAPTIGYITRFFRQLPGPCPYWTPIAWLHAACGKLKRENAESVAVLLYKDDVVRRVQGNDLYPVWIFENIVRRDFKAFTCDAIVRTNL